MVLRHDSEIHQILIAIIVHGVAMVHRAIMHVAGLEGFRCVIIFEMSYATDDINYL